MTSREDTFWTWTDLALFLSLGLPAFFIAFYIVRVTLLPFTANKALLLMIPQFAGQAAMLGPLAMLFRWKYEQRLSSAIRLQLRAADALPSFAAGIVLAISVLLLAVAIRVPEIRSPMQELMDDPRAAVWVGVFAVSIGPAFEEIFFRGLLQPVAVRSAGVIAGILIGALPFALLHGPQYAWSWRHILLIAVAGSAFGWWRFRLQSTGASAVMHAAYNTVLVVGLLFGKSAL